MAQRKTPLVAGEYYHIYNRGTNRQAIFFDEFDYIRFTELLYLCNSTQGFNYRDNIINKGIDVWSFDRLCRLISVGAWALMPNHFHIYLTEPEYLSSPKVTFGVRKSNISSFMEKLGTAYTKYVNTRHERSGALFGGTFKSVHITNDIQAQYLFAYIHLNPLKLLDIDWQKSGVINTEMAQSFLRQYRWSSYLDHLGIVRKESAILNLEDFPHYLRGQKLDDEIREWFKRGDLLT